MEHLFRADLKSPKDFLKDAPGRFVCSDLTGDDDVLELLKDTQGLEDRVKSPVEVGYDSQAVTERE